MPRSDTTPAGDAVRDPDFNDFDLRLDRYRLIQPKAELLMARSLSKYSQLAPVVYCQLEGWGWLFEVLQIPLTARR